VDRRRDCTREGDQEVARAWKIKLIEENNPNRQDISWHLP